MNAQWDIPLHVDTSLAAFVRGVLPTAVHATDSSSAGSNNRSDGGSQTSADRRRHSGDSRHLSNTAVVSTVSVLLTFTLSLAMEDWCTSNSVPSLRTPERMNTG